jgi:hypothetical protein
MAFRFYNRNTGEKIRFILNDFQDETKRPKRQRFILEATFDNVFPVSEIVFVLPERARLFLSVKAGFTERVHQSTRCVCKTVKPFALTVPNPMTAADKVGGRSCYMTIRT